MYTPQDWDYDPDRWARAIRSSDRKFRHRVEVWFDGQRQSGSAPFNTGAVTDSRVLAGVRRTLGLTVPASWQRWFDLPGFLELRVFSALRLSASRWVEAPMGVYPLLKPKRTWPAGEVSFTADDYWQRVVRANFNGPTMSPGGKLTEQAATLMVQAGLGRPEITATSSYSARSVLLENKTRTEAVAAMMRSVSAEAWVDRFGNPKIVDAIGMGAPTSSTDRNAETATLEPDWAKVYNQVSVRSSAQDIDFGTITTPALYRQHPASSERLGYTNVYNFASPLLTDPVQAERAAATILARVSGLAESYTYTCVPDPLRDAGDTIAGITVGQIDTVTHPLTVDGRQTITTTNTQAEDPDA